MTNYNKATLATFFQDGDIPQGSDFANLIDSQVNLVETVIQTMAGPLSTTELDTALVSAFSINCTGSFVASIITGAPTITGGATLTGGPTITGGVTIGGGGTVTGTLITQGLSPTSIDCGGKMSAKSMSNAIAIVSATGSTQATAALISSTIGVNRLQGVTDGQATGFLLSPPQSNLGLYQTLIYEGAVSANLWPNSGCNINALGGNAAFALTANTTYIVIHKAVSSYAVK